VDAFSLSDADYIEFLEGSPCYKEQPVSADSSLYDTYANALSHHECRLEQSSIVHKYIVGLEDVFGVVKAPQSLLLFGSIYPDWIVALARHYHETRVHIVTALESSKMLPANCIVHPYPTASRSGGGIPRMSSMSSLNENQVTTHFPGMFLTVV
jgi:hypothetical protein